MIAKRRNSRRFQRLEAVHDRRLGGAEARSIRVALPRFLFSVDRVRQAGCPPAPQPRCCAPFLLCDGLYAEEGFTPAGGPRGRVSLRWREVPEGHRPTLD